ncbi:elongation factor 1-delta 2-like [Trifolium medium]|uniref:Elongation factor 1-delta 2-like n=1 Tax=Trifolium medium TaxID=97028 RepID=A0A392MBC7_9FABA|nr:elongation factor 1-delta 2-like [Trifolium medium]
MKVISYNSKSEFKWKKLDEYISTRTYISGNRASMDDLTVYAALSSVPSGEFVNLARWYKHINAILRRISGVYGEGSGGTVKSFLVAEKAVATSAFATSMSAVSKVIQEYVPVKMSLSESGLKKLNEHLRTHTYISGNRASNDDLTVFAVLPSVPSSGFVNLARWYKHIDDLLIRIPGVYGEGSGGTVKSSLVDDTKMSDYFIGMGFPAQMVSEVILEYGEENKHKLLQGLVTSYRYPPLLERALAQQMVAAL